ncbi:biotin synthase, partial [Candidatus Magnetoovum chiemensis]
MELLIKSVEILRTKYCFNGYVHLKLIPGAEDSLVKRAGELADRVSVNIELPTKESLELLAPQKTKELAELTINFYKRNYIEG